MWILFGSSTPPKWNGWHLSMRQAPSIAPTTAPLRRTDPIMYSEQLGWNLQQLPMCGDIASW